MPNEYRAAGDDTADENQALSGRLEEILQTVRRIETELHVLTARVEQVEDSPPLEPLEKVTD